MLNLNLLKTTRERKNPMSAAKLRLQEDLKEFNVKDCNLRFPDPDNLMQFELTIKPDEGYYKNGFINFSINVTGSYPHEPPKVKCLTNIFHPNIDGDGNICLNILREDWCPVLSINSIVLGLQYLLLEPRAEDALNSSAADMLTSFPDYFGRYVTKLLHQNKAFSPTSSTMSSL